MVCLTTEQADHKKRWSAPPNRQTTKNDGLPHRTGRPQKTMVCPTEQADHKKRWSAYRTGRPQKTMVCPTEQADHKKRWSAPPNRQTTKNDGLPHRSITTPGTG